MIRRLYGRDDRSVVIRRKLIAILYGEGFKARELSAAFKVSERTVWNCVRMLKANGKH